MHPWQQCETNRSMQHAAIAPNINIRKVMSRSVIAMFLCRLWQRYWRCVVSSCARPTGGVGNKDPATQLQAGHYMLQFLRHNKAHAGHVGSEQSAAIFDMWRSSAGLRHICLPKMSATCMRQAQMICICCRCRSARSGRGRCVSR